MEQPITETSAPVTLDTIHKKISYWRANKHKYKEPGIPNDIWLMFFSFEDAGNSGQELRRMFSLNSSQYEKKRQELCAPQKLPEADACIETADFCEVVYQMSTNFAGGDN